MIFVFKTSVRTEKEVKELRPLLDQFFRPSFWNFDLEDCDNILWAFSENTTTSEVIRLLQEKGFDCEELPDD